MPVHREGANRLEIALHYLQAEAQALELHGVVEAIERALGVLRRSMLQRSNH